MVSFADYKPPQSPDAELGALATLILDAPNAWDEVSEVVTEEQFHHYGNRLIFRAVKAMMERGEAAIDAITIAAELENAGVLEDIGGTEHLLLVMERVQHVAHAKGYASIVNDRFLKRALADACIAIVQKCENGGGFAQDAIEAAESAIAKVAEQHSTGADSRLPTILVETVSRLDERMRKGVSVGMSTGFVDLDRQTNGLRSTELIVLGARPSMGKTAFACNMALEVARHGTPVMIFSLEQGACELAERLICIEGRLDGHRLQRGEIDDAERFTIQEALDTLGGMPIRVDDKPSRTVGQIAAIVRRLKRKEDLGLVIIDYLQLIESEDRKAIREQQIAQISRRLKALAKEAQLPIIALSQLSRAIETRDDKRPRMSDLRESGAIEQDADVIMMLHRPEVYNSEDQPGLAEVVVVKNRSGPTGIVNLTWRKQLLRFENHCQAQNFSEELYFPVGR